MPHPAHAFQSSPQLSQLPLLPPVQVATGLHDVTAMLQLFDTMMLTSDELTVRCRARASSGSGRRGYRRHSAAAGYLQQYGDVHGAKPAGQQGACSGQGSDDRG